MGDAIDDWRDPEDSRIITFRSVLDPDRYVTRQDLSCWHALVYCSLEQARVVAEREQARHRPATKAPRPVDAFSLDNLPEPKR